ncbi:myogenesis-regulating glycosidase isoform X1 [Leptopilina boulardi]|uniref:myogenesis-regulating glycosidase isoform X1 n=1 Tax=Leptopilina boulardi TaxID=63433 RepID=UPI0021F5A5E3|nr:myogenesis-regulating glycosidase isoform X1 [Leptopilina boulardi]
MNGTKKKKKKPLKEKKVLLSIVDPWDVKVASVDPIRLHERRGISLSDIPTSTNTGSQVWPSSNSPIKIPSPWYKPGSSSFCYSDARKPFESHSACDLKSIPRVIVGLNTGAFSSDGTFKPNKSIKDNKNTKVESNFPIGFEEFINVNNNNSPTDTSRVRFANGRETSSKLINPTAPKLNDISVGHQENFANFKPHFPHNITITVEDYCDNENSNNTKNNELKPEIKSNRLRSIVQELVESRYTPSSPHYKRSRRLLSSQTPFKIDQTDENVPLTPFNEIEIIPLNSRTEEKSENSSNSPSTTEIIGLGSKIRKTSISMPSKLDDMDDLRINDQKGVPSKFSRPESDSSTTFSNSGSTPNGSELCSETEDEENDEKFSKIPVQPPPRRKSTSPASNQKLENDNLNPPGAPSPHSTITSVNSIQSLLKEKFQLSLPQALRNNKQRQNADYRLRAFVGMLFLCIVFLVGFAYAYYNTHVLQRAYFDRFRFNNNERLMHIYNRAGSEIIAARLGLGISSESGVFECLPQHQKRKSVCLEWLDQTRLYLSHGERDSMDCYKFIWQSLSPSFNPKDCFDWSHNRGHWYGGGQIQNMAYPLEQGKLELSPFITGDIQKHPFGNVLKRYFLNSKGATILVDPDTPLYVSINANRTKEFCLQAKYDNFAYINHPTPLPSLSYSICATDNMKNLHSTMAEKTLWDGLTPDELHAVHALLTEPVWQISPTNEAAIYNYTEDVILLGFLRQGHVLLSEEWQTHPGDFVLDETRFPSMEETINIMHRRGFRIVFSIQPFISTESQNFQDAVTNRLLISERGSDPRIPALTRYKNISSAGVLDITNNKTLPWLMSKLENLISKYHVDSFYLDMGTAHDMPQYYKCEYPLTNPDHYKTIFSKAILNSVPVIGVSGAISRPRAPVFVSLPPFPSSWKAIKTVIPTILSYGMIGYPFIMPGAVGGDVALPMSDNNPDNDFEVSLPDKELYVRWLQLSTFLPVIRFTHLPSKYADSEVLDMARQLTILRQKTVTPLLKKYANNTLDTGLPIIRPLWMLDPTDPACHVVVDEFSVGEELIVAPILYSGSRQREVYLPAGVWRDGIDGSLRKGSRWIHNYKVRDVQIAYFVKMPDNTRF